MVILILVFAASLVPSIVLYFWLKGLRREEAYQASCKSAMKKGLLCVFLVIALSASFALIKNLLLKEVNPLLVAVFHDFIVLALAEEVAKYLNGRKVIDGAAHDVSWLDMMVIMCIVGIGFGIAEDILASIGASVPMMVIRGVTIGHGVLGVMCGWFLGKGFKEGKDIGFRSIIVPWLYHGLYDFGLSEEFAALGDWTAIVSVSIAFLDFVLIVAFVFFVRKARNNPKYTEPLITHRTEE